MLCHLEGTPTGHYFSLGGHHFDKKNVIYVVYYKVFFLPCEMRKILNVLLSMYRNLFVADETSLSCLNTF